MDCRLGLDLLAEIAVCADTRGIWMNLDTAVWLADDRRLPGPLALPRLAALTGRTYARVRKLGLNSLIGPRTPTAAGALDGIRAAALHDIGGLTHGAIARQLGYSLDVSHKTGRVRSPAAGTAARRARPLLAELRLWPWGCWRDGRPPPDWQRGSDDAAWTTLADWFALRIPDLDPRWQAVQDAALGRALQAGQVRPL